MSEGIPFTLENSKYIRQISYVIMVSPGLSFVFNLISYYYFRNTIEISNGLYVFLPNFDFITLFLGLIILIIAEIFKVGYTIQEEQKLVI